MREVAHAGEAPPLEAYAGEVSRRGNGAASLEAPQATRPHGEEPANLLALLWYATLERVEPPEQLIKGLLIASSLLVVYGESNCGKTFLTLDLALAVAAAIPWRGRRVQRGLVIYVAGEGAASVRGRVAAYRRAHPEVPGGIPFAVVSQAVDFLSAESVASLIATIRAAQSESGEKIALIVIDTFARAIAGGDENKSQDVGLAVAAADRIRKETGACVAFVHHAGKDPAKGARGSSALRAATDTEILVEGQSGIRTATVTKQRDLESGQRFGFKLRSVELGRDEDGEPVTSCVVDPAEEIPSERKAPTGKNQRLVLTALKEWQREHPTADIVSSLDLRAIAKSQGITKKSRLAEALDPLQKLGWLVPCVGGFRFQSEEQL